MKKEHCPSYTLTVSKSFQNLLTTRVEMNFSTVSKLNNIALGFTITSNADLMDFQILYVIYASR